MSVKTAKPKKANTEPATLHLRSRALRAVPSHGLAPGQVFERHVEARYPTGVDWGEIVAGFESGAIEGGPR